MNNWSFQVVETPFDGDILCLDITKRCNVLVITTKGEVWLTNMSNKWHKVKNNLILYSSGGPKIW